MGHWTGNGALDWKWGIRMEMGHWTGKGALDWKRGIGLKKGHWSISHAIFFKLCVAAFFTSEKRGIGL